MSILRWPIPHAMLKNYLITTLQYLQKNKAISVINLTGLTMGLTVSFFALLYVNFELSYDSYHQNADRIYRIVTDVKSSTGIDYRGSAVPLAPAIREAFPEVQASTRIVLDYLIIQKEGGTASEEKIAYADSSFFSVFTRLSRVSDFKSSTVAFRICKKAARILHVFSSSHSSHDS